MLVMRHHRTLQEPVATYRVFVQNLVFYTGVEERPTCCSDQQVVDYLRSTERVLCVHRRETPRAA